MPQFIRHINEDVLPPLLEKLSSESTVFHKDAVAEKP
jgi:hypothetical protein